MGAVLTVNETSSEMVRLVGGKLVQETSQRNLYIVPPRGEYEFMITGYALPFEMPKAAEYGGGTQTMTRIEFTIVNHAKPEANGRMWTELIGFTMGEKSNLGRLLRKLQVDLTPNDRGEWDLDRAIGYRGRGYLVPSDKLDEQGKPKYAKLTLDSVAPVAPPDKAYSIKIEEREPATAGASNGNGHKPAASDDGWPE